MKSPISNEVRIQQMSEEQLRARLAQIDSTPRDRMDRVGEDERREILLELERHKQVRSMEHRKEVNLAKAAGAPPPLTIGEHALTEAERRDLATWVLEVTNGARR